jgi:adenylyltransferase/sulfurtransferase
MLSKVLSELELRRYSKQLVLPSVGLAGQEKIKQSKVLVAGAGGKGTSLMQYLVSSGVGRIGISDCCLVEEKILPDQTLYGNNDLGKHKAIISKQKLTEINHLTKIQLHNVCLSEKNIISICNEYDIIVDATDNLPTHYLIDKAAIRLNKPVVYGCIHRSQACISVFNYNGGPSFSYMYSQYPAEKEEVPLKGVVSVGITYGITGIIMANEVLKVILDLPNTLSGELLIIDTSAYIIKKLKIRNNSGNL